VTWLLDTNSWGDHLRRGSASTVTARLLAVPPGSIYLCSLVVGELLYGALHSGPAYQANNLALVASLRRQFTSLPFDDRAAQHYGAARAHLANLGMLIGPNDLLIAATALANGCTLVTHNTQEFSRVPGLQVEDWQLP
jgi:tRNA(fMet)-specific endonuclease VapC